jgi:hypothetical protein
MKSRRLIRRHRIEDRTAHPSKMSCRGQGVGPASLCAETPNESRFPALDFRAGMFALIESRVGGTVRPSILAILGGDPELELG